MIREPAVTATLELCNVHCDDDADDDGDDNDDKDGHVDDDDDDDSWIHGRTTTR